jgi:hypothetical protein
MRREFLKIGKSWTAMIQLNNWSYRNFTPMNLSKMASYDINFTRYFHMNNSKHNVQIAFPSRCSKPSTPFLPRAVWGIMLSRKTIGGGGIPGGLAKGSGFSGSSSLWSSAGTRDLMKTGWEMRKGNRSLLESWYLWKCYLLLAHLRRHCHRERWARSATHKRQVHRRWYGYLDDFGGRFITLNFICSIWGLFLHIDLGCYGASHVFLRVRWSWKCFHYIVTLRYGTP